MHIAAMPMIETVVQFMIATKYPLFFAGSYLEGTVAMLTGGILLKLGHVQFLPLYIALMLGDILSDTMWYCVGYFGARRFLSRWGYLINATPDVIAKLERRFHTYHLRILVISKMTMGLGFAVPILTTAGMLRVPFARYIAINILGGLVWVAGMVWVGYSFGNVLALVPGEFQIVFACFMICVFFIGLRMLNKRLEKVEW